MMIDVLMLMPLIKHVKCVNIDDDHDDIHISGTGRHTLDFIVCMSLKIEIDTQTNFFFDKLYAATNWKIVVVQRRIRFGFLEIELKLSLEKSNTNWHTIG